MSRPIDADALIKILEPHSMRNGAALGWHSGLIDTVIDEIRKMPTIGGWISVKDRMPDKQPEEYLAVNGRSVETAICLDNGWITPKRVINITHWMPLPEPPEEETK